VLWDERPISWEEGPGDRGCQLYAERVDTPIDPSRPLPEQPTAGRFAIRPSVRVFALSFLCWSLVCLLMAYTTYSDAVRGGKASSLWNLFRTYFPYFLPYTLFSVVLHRILAGRIRTRIAEPKVLLGLLLATYAFFYVPFLAYQMMLKVYVEADTLASIWRRLAAVPIMLYLDDMMILLVGFGVHYGSAFVRELLLKEQQRRVAESEALNLRLAFEHQRLIALQAQLEPHFLFNALNAISALVRSEDRSGALEAISGLSDLLREALKASRQDWSCVGAELDFIRQYLTLQKLRYGDRLNVVTTGADGEEVLSVECPPLLLQPLVENSIRHDLDRHEGPSDIRLSFGLEGPWLKVAVANQAHPQETANPGLGVGLGNVRERLQRIYGESARFFSGLRGGDFVVELQLPRYPRG